MPKSTIHAYVCSALSFRDTLTICGGNVSSCIVGMMNTFSFIKATVKMGPTTTSTPTWAYFVYSTSLTKAKSAQSHDTQLKEEVRKEK